MSDDLNIKKAAEQISQDTRRRRYIAPKKAHDWYEKAKFKIAISPNATATSEQRTPLSSTIKAAKTITF